MSLAYTIAEIASMMGIPVPEGFESVPVSGVSTDTRTLDPGDIFFALSGEHFDGSSFAEAAFARGAAAAVVPVPNPKGPCLICPNPLEGLQRLASRHRERCNAHIMAITGSCGKTTAKDMTAALLSSRYSVVKTLGNLNNDIGCPLSLLRIGSETQFAVIEMGANHKGEIAQLCRMARPVESAVTMVGPAHLEGFGDIEAVARAKAEIMEALPVKGCFYVNANDAFCVAMGGRFAGEKVYFGARGDVVLESLDFNDSGEMVLHIAPIGRLCLPLAVRAHSTNVLLAAAVGLRHGITDFEEPLRAASRSASRFKAIPFGSCTFLDDTYNANPASMKAALEALADYSGKRKMAVLGDMFELGEAASLLHAEVGAAAAQQGIDCLFSLGAHAKEMAEAAIAAGMPEALAFENHEDLAAAVREWVEGGDTILFKGSRGMKMEKVIHQLQSAPGGCV